MCISATELELASAEWNSWRVAVYEEKEKEKDLDLYVLRLHYRDLQKSIDSLHTNQSIAWGVCGIFVACFFWLYRYIRWVHARAEEDPGIAQAACVCDGQAPCTIGHNIPCTGTAYPALNRGAPIRFCYQCAASRRRYKSA